MSSADTMDITDDCIKEIREWFRRKERAETVRHLRVQPDTMPVPESANASPQIILKEDMQLELGHPSVGSCSGTLATHDAGLVDDGLVTLVGPDVSETKEKVLPFAQIAVACSSDVIEDTCSAMDRVLHTCAQTDGYMLRSVPDLIWARVSKEAAHSGFSLLEHGSRLLRHLNSRCDALNKCQIYFVTSTREDVAELNKMIDPARTKLRKLQTFGRKEDGTYECDTSLDCEECPEKPVCDTIREVITIRKGDRIIRIGEDDDNG